MARFRVEHVVCTIQTYMRQVLAVRRGVITQSKRLCIFIYPDVNTSSPYTSMSIDDVQFDEALLVDMVVSS